MAFDERVFDNCRRDWLGVFSSLWRFFFCGHRRGFQLVYEFFQLLVFGQNRLGDVRRSADKEGRRFGTLQNRGKSLHHGRA